MQIYISYGSTDKMIANRIRDELLHNHVSVLLNEIEDRVKQVPPGDMRSGLLGSNVLGILISSSSISSKWIRQEFDELKDYADSYSHVFIPCLISSMSVSELIRGYDCADFTQRFESGVAKLLTVVQTLEQSKSEEIESLYKRTISRLSNEELRFFLDWVPGEIIYVNFNREENQIDLPPVVETLSQLGLAIKYGTCQEDVWYDISPVGRLLQEFSSRNLSHR